MKISGEVIMVFRSLKMMGGDTIITIISRFGRRSYMICHYLMMDLELFICVDPFEMDCLQVKITTIYVH